MLESIFNKVTGLQLYYKEDPRWSFSCEYYENFKNSNFEEDLQTAASGL